MLRHVCNYMCVLFNNTVCKHETEIFCKVLLFAFKMCKLTAIKSKETKFVEMLLRLIVYPKNLRELHVGNCSILIMDA